MLVRLVKPPKIGDSRLCLVVGKKTNLNAPNQYKLVDLETYKKMTDAGLGATDSGANHYNNGLYGCNLKDGVGCSFFCESSQILELNATYDVLFLNDLTDTTKGIARIKILRRYPTPKKLA